MRDFKRLQATRSTMRIVRRSRGVASVLAMMFLVIFGSLAAVMAVVAQSNLRTADSYMKVSRASSAAEMGLIFAKRRLAEQSRRFVVSKGVVDDDFGTKLWMGTYSGADGTIEVLEPTDFVENPPAESVAEAVRNAHAADLHNIDVESGDSALPNIDEFGTLRVKPIGSLNQDGTVGVYFRLKYELLEDGRFVRVTSQGIDGDVSRTLQMDFRINKKIEYAVISPNRVMIGKNVHVEGPLGTRYGVVAGELDPTNGNPLVMRSDFYHLDDALDADLDLLYDAIAAYDVDGDNRLRPGHPTETDGVEGDLADYDGDEYVDDLDLFFLHFDTDGDGRVVYDEDLALAAGLGSLTEEFTTDQQLGQLIDFANADRNSDGDVDATDTALGYGDGVIDGKDYYAKVNGRLAFAVVKDDWETARSIPTYQELVQGPMRTEPDVAAATFEVSEEDMLDITTAQFDDNQSWLKTKAQAGAPFQSQVDDNIAAGATYTAPGADTWETVPYGAKGYYDWYQRPIYEDMTFTDLSIPMGNNGLFINCTFIGATFIETHETNADVNWNYAGMMDKDGDGDMVEKYPTIEADLGDGTMVNDTKPYSNNIRFHDCTFAGSVAADATDEFAHVRNKVQFTGQTEFTLEHEELDEGDIVEFEKSSILMPGYSVDVGDFTNSNVDPVELSGTIIAGVLDARGTVDVFGTLLMTFRPVEGEGPLFYGGTPDNFNTTLGYFGPDDGDAESVDPSTLVDTDGDGLPDIGMDLDGDGFNDPFMGFGQITLRYNPDGKLPDGIPWPIVIEAEDGTYTEGGTM